MIRGTNDKDGSWIKHELFYIKAARVLAQKLRNVEPDHIMITDRQGFFSSLESMMQIFFERKIGSAINWWPLPEPNRPLVDNPNLVYSGGWRLYFKHTNVVWTCVSTMVELLIGSDYYLELWCSTINGRV
jgi:hypothetical protein